MRLIFLIITTFLIRFAVIAQKEDNVVIISSVSYDYELFYTESGRLDCKGTLSFDVQHPANSKMIIIERTKSRLYDADRQLFTIRGMYDSDKAATTTHIVMGNPIIWGCRFKARAYIDNETSYYSDVFDIDDYIAPEDLALLLESQSASINSPQDSEPKISFTNGTLVVDNMETATLSIFDLQGRSLLSREISGRTSISLNDFDTNLLIVKLQTSNNLILSRLLKK